MVADISGWRHIVGGHQVGDFRWTSKVAFDRMLVLQKTNNSTHTLPGFRVEEPPSPPC